MAQCHSRSRAPGRRERAAWAAVVAAALLLIWPGPARSTHGQCGDHTFTQLHLPSVEPGLTDHAQFSVPNGCAIYLLIASDYGRNRDFDELLLYPLAKWVAENDGYVHWAWWNNLLSPYLMEPLHSTSDGRPQDPGVLASVGLIEDTLGIDLVGEPGIDEIYINDLVRFIPATQFIRILALGFEAFVNDIRESTLFISDGAQFVADAEVFVEEIRRVNPNALILLAGHGFGAHSVVKVARAVAPARIDLLAAIDPVGTDTSPSGRDFATKLANPDLSHLLRAISGPGGTPHLNPQSRWRVINDFRGYQQNDCIRGLTFLECRDFDPRIFFFDFRCIQPGPTWLATPPFFPSRAPLLCPKLIVHPGDPVLIGGHVRYLYHRWQTEAGPPDDFGLSPLFFHYPAKLATTLEGPNVQAAMSGFFPVPGPLPGDFPRVGGPGTCDVPEGGCDMHDGHDELVGFRGEPLLKWGSDIVSVRTPVGVRARQWPDSASGRLEKLLFELPTPDPDLSWVHRPEDPGKCLVCGDLVFIAQHLLAQQPSPSDSDPPTSTAAASPAANAEGWHMGDVLVALSAADSGGSGVLEIEHETVGAQGSGVVVTAGDLAEARVSAEGFTAVRFFARDNAGNVESPPNEFDVRLDRTPPQVSALTDVPANAHGWNRTDVEVSFPALDEPFGSGLAVSTDPFLVDTEGESQEIIGVAEDHAGNQASASVVLNIDKNAPDIAFTAHEPPPNAAGWNNTGVEITWTCSDGLSGPASPSVRASASSEGAAQELTAVCLDLADNSASNTRRVHIDRTAPDVRGAPDRGPDRSGWYNRPLAVSWSGVDALSGVRDCDAQTLYGGPDATTASVTGSCTDLAENTASATVEFQFDATPPTIQIAVPADGARYLLNQQASASYACSDNLSGVRICEGPVASGAALATASVGPQPFRVDAGDVAGNDADRTHVYHVRYRFSGFLEPVHQPTGVTRAKAGRTIPIKYRLSDASETDISDLASFVSLRSAPAVCEADPSEPITGAEAVTARLRRTGNHFHLNWKTSAAWAGTCRILQLILADGAEHRLRLQFE